MERAIKQSRQKRPLGEVGLSEEEDESLQAEGVSRWSQSEESCHAFWNPEEHEGDPLSRFRSGVAHAVRNELWVTPEAVQGLYIVAFASAPIRRSFSTYTSR